MERVSRGTRLPSFRIFWANFTNQRFAEGKNCLVHAFVQVTILFIVTLLANPAQSQNLQDPAVEARSARISECVFRFLFSTDQDLFRPVEQRLIEEATIIVRRTGVLYIQGMFSEASNPETAIRNSNFARRAFISGGIQESSIIMRSEEPRASAEGGGAWLRVCRTGRNVDNGWRTRPIDINYRIKFQVDDILFSVPILYTAPSIWNDIPFSVSNVREIFLNRSENSDEFAGILNQCWPLFQESRCDNIFRISILRGTPHMNHGSVTGAPSADLHSNIIYNLAERRVYYTLLLREELAGTTSVQCRSELLAEQPFDVEQFIGIFECQAFVSILRRNVYGVFEFRVNQRGLIADILRRVSRQLHEYAEITR